MNLAPAPDDTLGKRIARAIQDALEVRRGEVLTPELIRERANNAACYVLDVIGQHEGGAE